MTQRIGMAYTQLGEEEIEAAVRVLRSGRLRQGPECAAFEEAFAAKSGAKHAITCANGTAALHLAYLAILEPGDEVLVPAFTFFATASTVALSGATPVFCDVDPKTMLLDLDDARSKVTDKTKAIAPVHLFGNVCDKQAVQAFADEFGLQVIWDSAQAHGAEQHGQDVGSFEGMVCYSFYPTKNMSTGEGGMICTHDDDLAGKLRLLRSHGQGTKYRHTVLGLNYRMTDVEAAVGRIQLDRLDDMLATRRRNGKILNDAFASVPGLNPQVATEGCNHAYHQYCMTIDTDEFGMSRDELRTHLDECGIDSGIHYPRGLHTQPIFVERYGKHDMPVTDSLVETIVALPVHHALTKEQVSYVADTIVKAHK